MQSLFSEGSRGHKDLVLDLVVVALLMLTWLVLVLANFSANTWLLSWDVMATEFNPGLAISRSLFSSWQSYQGLGVFGGHGYNAQLPHALFQLLLLVIIPLQYARYVFTFLMLLAGGLGAFWLSRYSLKEMALQTPNWIIAASGGVVGFVYMLHPATVQTFYVHLEPFIVMYGLGPWVLWWLFELLKKPSVQKYLVWIGLQFGLSVIGFVPPVFVLFSVFVGVVFVWHLVLHRFSVLSLRTVLAVGISMIVVHLYWLLPVSVFSLTQSDDYLSANLNQLTTQENALKSAYYGQVSEVVWPRSFYFDSLDQDRFLKSSQLSYTFQPWRDWFDQSWTGWIGALMLLLAILGWAWISFYGLKKRALVSSLGVVGFSSFILMLRGQPELSALFSFLDTVPILNQAFRLPFSKLSMMYSLYLSMGIGFAVFALWKLSSGLSKILSWLLFSISAVGVVVGLLFLSGPVFNGHFLYKGARVDLPDSYLEVMTFLQNQNGFGRVAPFPMLTFSGWDMHDWPSGNGYTGSGFWWYGVDQPILHRSFDVWNPTNEQYRLQMAHAVYTRDVETFEKLLEIYQIKWILIDNTVFLPNVSQSQFYRSELREMISLIPGISRRLSSPELELYEVNSQAAYSRIGVVSEFESVSKKTGKNQLALPYLLGKQSVLFESGENKSVVPFFNLGNQQFQGITEGENTIKVISEIIEPGLYHLDQNEFGSKMAFKIGVQPQENQEGLSLFLEPVLPTLFLENEVIVQQPTSIVSLANDHISHFRINSFIYQLPSTVSRAQYLGPLYVDTGNTVEIGLISSEEELPISLNFSPSEESVVTFRLQEKGVVRVKTPWVDEPTSLCISASQSIDCLNPTTRIERDSPETQVLFLDAGTYTLSGSMINLAKNGIEVFQLEEISTQLLESEFWDQYLENKMIEVSIDAPTYIKAEFPKLGLGWVPENIDSESCSFQAAGDVRRELDIGRNTIRYFADNEGIVCDAYFFHQVPLDNGLLAKLETSNQEGLPLKVYGKDLISDRTSFEIYTAPNNEISTTWFPILPVNGSGFAMTIENRSIHTFKASNYLHNVSVFVAPLHAMLNVKLFPANKTPTYGSLSINHQVELGSSFAWVNVTTTERKPGILSLSESYNQSWLAYSLSSRNFLEKVQVDGWSNGWIVPPGNHIVVLFFWPQLLSLGGYLLLIGVVMILVLKESRDKK